MADLGADVLAVREVDHLLERSGRTDQTAQIAAACADRGTPWAARFAAAVDGTPGDRATFAPASLTRPDVASYGVALLSRHPVREWWELRAWAATLPRPLLLLGDLNLPGSLPSRIAGWTPLARARTYPASRPRVQLDHALLDDPDGVLEPGSAEAQPVAQSDHRAIG